MNIDVLNDQKIKILSPRDLYPVMREILLRDDEYDRNKEHFWCVALAHNSMLQYVELISLGTLNQSVVEHLIITTEGFYSFESSGDIKRLNLSKKYVPGYLEIERIQKEAQRIGEKIGRKKGEEKGKKERDKEIAKMMKDKGTEIEFISEITGLSKEEIEKM